MVVASHRLAAQADRGCPPRCGHQERLERTSMVGSPCLHRGDMAEVSDFLVTTALRDAQRTIEEAQTKQVLKSGSPPLQLALATAEC